MFVVISAFSKVYTFGPTFRADNSRTRHHLAEFSMVEAELAFTHSIDDIIKVCGLHSTDVIDRDHVFEMCDLDCTNVIGRNNHV